MKKELSNRDRKDRDDKCKKQANNFDDIVKCYLNSQVLVNEEWNENISTHNLYIEPWKENVKKSKNIEEAIKKAVSSRDSNKKCHGHQKRIRKNVYRKYYKLLIQRKEAILICRSFDELVKIGDEISDNVKWAGYLFSYDVMLRIAEYLKAKHDIDNILPTKVYLHAHPEKSAKTLFPNLRLSRTIKKCVLPKEFERLKPYQCEEVLCIYHDAIVKASKDRWVAINGVVHN